MACTRKQNPGTKQLSIKAVKAGGGSIHRLGLSESILVFAEHRQFFGPTQSSGIIADLAYEGTRAITCGGSSFCRGCITMD